MMFSAKADEIGKCMIYFENLNFSDSNHNISITLPVFRIP